MSNWTDICNVDDIMPNMGRCALVNGEQVAIFKVKGLSTEAEFFALSNYCPFSEANVLSRGLVGSTGDKVFVASPLYKQHFVLTTGECLEDDSVSLKTYPVRIEGNKVQLAA